MEKALQDKIDTQLDAYAKHIDKETLLQLVDVHGVHCVPKGQLLLTEDTAFFLLSGLIRGFYLDGQGHDVTHQFIFENSLYGSDFLTTDKPHSCSYEALEDCVLLPVHIRKLKAHMQTDTKLLLLYVHMLEEALKRKIERESSLISQTATERYLDFVATHPDIKTRVSQIHIASYLGITAESLSRIRRTLRN